MELREWQTNWNELGKDDPLWVVLTDPSKKGGKWDPKEFFATGEKEIDELMNHLNSIGASPTPKVALDFGCGVGRLSQALARHFEIVHGVDISPSMVEHARKFNRFGDKVQYHVNSSNRLQDFEDRSVDFVHSNITLQHIEPRYAKVFIQEFARILKPGGIGYFQFLEGTFARRIFPEGLVATYRKWKHQGKPYIGMFGIPENHVRSIISDSGGQILEAKQNPWSRRWISWQFCFRIA